MIQKINKRYMAINCPLCDYTYIADKGEVYETDNPGINDTV